MNLLFKGDTSYKQVQYRFCVQTPVPFDFKDGRRPTVDMSMN